MKELDNKELESKIAFLERHIEEQDKVILKLSSDVQTIAKELLSLKESLPSGSQGGNDLPVEERPPHY